MALAHKLSMELRAAEDRTNQLQAEVELWRDRAARAEQWLRISSAEQGLAYIHKRIAEEQAKLERLELQAKSFISFQ
jgi:hypothetical protein